LEVGPVPKVEKCGMEAEVFVSHNAVKEVTVTQTWTEGGEGVDADESHGDSDGDSDQMLVGMTQKCKAVRTTIHSGNYSVIYMYVHMSSMTKLYPSFFGGGGMLSLVIQKIRLRQAVQP
jgi:hypothetical protein